MAPLRHFLENNWFDLVQTVSIVLGLLFTGASFRRERSARNLSNLLAIKQEHRELWNTVHERPELARILAPDADLLSQPMTRAEEIFLRQIIVHVAVSFELIQTGTPLDMEAFRSDVGEFFSLPLPHAAWRNIRSVQKCDLVQFLEGAVSARNQK